MAMERAPKLPPEQYEQNFADINPPLTRSQALEESARCLFCFDAPCIAACPTGIDVPQFIRMISTGNMRGSAHTILSANILGQSCGRVCPTEVLCEGACVLNHQGRRPVAIGRLQRHAVDWSFEKHIQHFTAGAPNGRSVALIGSGPASLSCAAELRKLGYRTVCFDRAAQPGGLNTYGIAAYKLRAQDALREIEMIKELGVELRQNVTVGTDVTLDQLEREFDVIFVGVGLGETEDLQIPGEDLLGFLDALSFIEQTKTFEFPEIEVGRRVAVIGAGNTAVDVATAAVRLGAEEVTMVYRRSHHEMPAFHYEYELAKNDGVQFMWQTLPVRVVGRGHVEALECVRTRLGPPDASGRRRPERIAGSEFQVECDMVVKALGQKRQIGFFKTIAGLEVRDGCVVVNEHMQTGNPRYFSGGDCVNGGQEVVDAVADGKRAAAGIHATLEAKSGRSAHA